MIKEVSTHINEAIKKQESCDAFYALQANNPNPIALKALSHPNRTGNEIGLIIQYVQHLKKP